MNGFSLVFLLVQASCKCTLLFNTAYVALGVILHAESAVGNSTSALTAFVLANETLRDSGVSTATTLLGLNSSGSTANDTAITVGMAWSSSTAYYTITDNNTQTLPNSSSTLAVSSADVLSSLKMDASTVTTSTAVPTIVVADQQLSTTIPYLITTILIVPNFNPRNKTFWYTMESRLAQVCSMAFTRSERISLGTYVASKRRKRVVVVNDVAVQMVNVTTVPNYASRVELIYAVAKGGNLISATVAVNVLGLLSSQEMALILQYVVIQSPQEFNYVAPVDYNYWIIGAVLGPIAFVALIWLISCILVRKRLRRRMALQAAAEQPIRAGGSPELLSIKVDEGGKATRDTSTILPNKTAIGNASGSIKGMQLASREPFADILPPAKTATTLHERGIYKESAGQSERTPAGKQLLKLLPHAAAEWASDSSSKAQHVGERKRELPQLPASKPTFLVSNIQMDGSQSSLRPRTKSLSVPKHHSSSVSSRRNIVSPSESESVTTDDGIRPVPRKTHAQMHKILDAVMYAMFEDHPARTRSPSSSLGCSSSGSSSESTSDSSKEDHRKKKKTSKKAKKDKKEKKAKKDTKEKEKKKLQKEVTEPHSGNKGNKTKGHQEQDGEVGGATAAVRHKGGERKAIPESPPVKYTLPETDIRTLEQPALASEEVFTRPHVPMKLVGLESPSVASAVFLASPYQAADIVSRLSLQTGKPVQSSGDSVGVRNIDQVRTRPPEIQGTGPNRVIVGKPFSEATRPSDQYTSITMTTATLARRSSLLADDLGA